LWPEQGKADQAKHVNFRPAQGQWCKDMRAMTDMTIDERKALIIEHFRYMGIGEYQKAIEKFSDDMVWWVLGTQEHGGTHTRADLAPNLSR